jgi:hypothetical protein
VDDEFAAGVTFFTWSRLIIGGLDLADQIGQELCAIEQQRLAQTFLQPPDVAYRARAYFLECVPEEAFGLPVFFF